MNILWPLNFVKQQQKRDCTLNTREIPAFKWCWEMSIIQLVLVKGGSCVCAEAGVFMF